MVRSSVAALLLLAGSAVRAEPPKAGAPKEQKFCPVDRKSVV